MTKKLVALVLAGVFAANVNVSASVDAKLAQAADQVSELVAVAQEAGLSKDQTVALIAEQLDNNKAFTTLSPNMKKALLAAGVIVVVGGGAYIIKRTCIDKKAEVPADKAAADKAPANQAPANQAPANQAPANQAPANQEVPA